MANVLKLVDKSINTAMGLTDSLLNSGGGMMIDVLDSGRMLTGHGKRIVASFIKTQEALLVLKERLADMAIGADPDKAAKIQALKEEYVELSNLLDSLDPEDTASV